MTPFSHFQKKPVLLGGAHAVEAVFITVRAFVVALAKART
jgi:hypothetical protein